jgi:serine/threonine-protein kinase
MTDANVEGFVGRMLGRRYELAERIGSGASAEVFRAVDRNLEREVAVKQLRSHLSEDPRFVKLFRTEAHLVAQLDHPNVVTVFDWSADEEGEDGGAFIVTELLDGGTLRDWLKAEPTLPADDVAFVGLQVAQGLHAAHQAGLVHRDIKPANLLFGREGRLRIADFGIARAVAEAAWTEPEGRLIGTARYAAPEQANTGAVNGLADVYSLAVCMIEAVVGDVPLVGDNAVGTMYLRRERDLPVDPALGPLAEVVAGAGRRDPEQRWSSDQLRHALLDICQNSPNFGWLKEIDLTEFGGLDANAVPSRRAGLGTGEGSGPDGSDGMTAAGDGPPPNVFFAENGDLIIQDDDGIELALPEPADLMADDDGLLPTETASVHPLGPLPSVGPPAGRGRRLALLAAIVLLLGAAGAIGGYQYLQMNQPVTEVIELGLPTYPVGDYRQASVEEVEAEAESNGWTVSVTETFDDDTAAGTLLSQRPQPGTQLSPGGVVELELSRGPRPRTVPALSGLTETDVRDALEAADLVVGEVTTSFDEQVGEGVVLEATIEGAPAVAGDQYPPRTAVDLVVSAGPQPRVVPGLSGQTVEQATVLLEAEDLLISVGEEYSESVTEGQIIASSPAAGAEVPRGSTVAVTVSLGLPFVEVPDLAGRPVAEAIDELKALGFEVQINGVVGSSVLGTRPGAGSSLRKGSSVEVISVD